MSTQYPALFTALAAPFEKGELKTRKQGGKALIYITARTAMNRLDDVLGPENWWDHFVASEHSVECRLTIRLPDGSTLTKADAGGYAGMADSGDDDKSGYSDGFKRAAVKFGVARYLYRDGVPRFVSEAYHGRKSLPAPPAPALPEAAPSPARKPLPWAKFLHDKLTQANLDWHNEMAVENVEQDRRKEFPALANPFQVVNHLATRLVEVGRFTAQEIGKEDRPEVRDPEKARACVVATYGKSPGSIEKAVDKYLLSKRIEARVALGLDDGVAGTEADA